jgi:hypothetical protein
LSMQQNTAHVTGQQLAANNHGLVVSSIAVSQEASGRPTCVMRSCMLLLWAGGHQPGGPCTSLCSQLDSSSSSSPPRTSPPDNLQAPFSSSSTSSSSSSQPSNFDTQVTS